MPSKNPIYPQGHSVVLYESDISYNLVALRHKGDRGQR